MDNKPKLNPQYLSFHVHSIGSLRDGIMKVSDHVKFAMDNKKKYVSITDHGSISEWIDLYTQCNKNKLVPIYGCEGYIHRNRDKYLEEKEGKPDHIVLIVQNEIGFKNVIKIHNDAWIHFYKKPIMSYDFLKEHSEGVIVSSACMSGTLSKLLLEKDIAAADDFIEEMKAAFPNRFFIETMIIDMKEQDELNRHLIQMAKKHNVPILVTNDAHYLLQDDAFVHQISLLLQSNQTVDDLNKGNGWKFSAQDLFMKNEHQMYAAWKERYGNDPIFTEEVFVQATWNCDLITSTIEEVYLEHPPRLPSFKGGAKILQQMVADGFEEKMNLGYIPQDQVDEYIKRLEYEFQTIKDLDLVDYILLIKDIVDWCLANDIAVGPGRGSVSASLLTWVIGITKLDPIKYNFIFERFLNPARKTKLKIL